MKTAQEIIAKLPAYCWGVLRDDKSLIRIRAGEMGYFPLDQALDEDAIKVLGKEMSADEIADHLNDQLGVSKAQRSAMEWGSMFGWGHAASDPDHWVNAAKTSAS